MKTPRSWWDEVERVGLDEGQKDKGNIEKIGKPRRRKEDRTRCSTPILYVCVLHTNCIYWTKCTK